MYVGFTSSTGSVASIHYLLGWSFAHGGKVAQSLDLSKLSKLPRYEEVVGGDREVMFFYIFKLKNKRKKVNDF